MVAGGTGNVESVADRARYPRRILALTRYSSAAPAPAPAPAIGGMIVHIHRQTTVPGATPVEVGMAVEVAAEAIKGD